MNEFFDKIAMVGPRFENDSMIDGFRDAVLYGRSRAEEEAQALYNRLMERADA